MSNDSTSDDESFTLEPEQQAAARTLDRNVTVEAGAGTGKTTTLTERYLTILRAHLDGPAALHEDATDDEVPYHVPDDIERITDPTKARRLAERIVVTTFTDRAAEDLKQSIRAKIRDRLDEITDPEQWELWRAAADGVEASYIDTTHGFCGRILQEYAIQHPAVDPHFEVLDEDEATLLINTIVEAYIESEPPETHTLAALFDRQKLADVITGLLSEQAMTDEWLTHVEEISNKEQYEAFLVDLHPFAADPGELLRTIAPDIQALCELLVDQDVQDRFGSNPMKYVGTPLLEFGERLDGRNISSQSPIKRLSLCIDLCTTLTNGDNELYSEGNYFGNKSFRTAGDETARQFQETMTRVLDRLAPETRSIDASVAADRDTHEYLLALASLTKTIGERYEEEKQQRGVLDYNDLITHTIDFLENDGTAAAQLRSDIWYVMVDEFQDTNTRQWDLIQSLVAESDAFDADNVFVVGDTKQSIYRFRDADVTVFDTAVAELHAANTPTQSVDAAPELMTNFRTLPATLNAINGLFESIFAYGGSEPYEAVSGPLKPGRKSIPDVSPVTEYIPVLIDDELRDQYLPANHTLRSYPASEPADIEATAIASRIAELLNGETKVTAEDNGDTDSETTGRSVQPDDVAVLIRSRNALKDYERALRNASIPYTVVKGEGFFETSEIRALVSLFRAIADPSDEIALYAALRSPLFGVADETIAALHDSETSLWECLRRADDDTIQTVVSDFNRWRAYAGTDTANAAPMVTTWTEFANQILDETGYITAVAADERGVAAVANIDKFREKLREFDSDGVPSLKRVVMRLSDQASQGRTEAEANVADSGSGVRIMTIHEAKGQEFPVVVVPGLGKEFTDRARLSNGSVELERVPVGGNRTPVVGLKTPAENWGDDDRETLMRHAARDRRRAEEHAEEKRILYVACTRAEDHLILTGRHTADADHPAGVAQPDPTDPSSWLDWVQPVLFGSDTDATEAWNALETTGEFTARLSFSVNGDTRDGTITVRTPPSDASYEETTSTVEPITQRSEYDYTPNWEYVLSPSALSGLADGTKKLERDHESHQIRPVTTTEDDNTEDQHIDRDESMSAAVFGQAVHRLCETRPPRDTWSDFINQVAHEEHSVGNSTETVALATSDIKAIETATDRAISFLDTLHEQLDVLRTYDEFPIELDFADGYLSGLIDHLVVTPDAYHVVDYKTDRKRDDESIEEFLVRRASHHEPQVLAYAAALSKADSDRSVSATLFFTAVDSAKTWEPDDTTDAFETTIEMIRAATGGLDSD